MTSVINLSSNVIVSDPCYSRPTWCQTVLTDVLPGRYIAQVNEDPETGRCAELLVIHEDYYQSRLIYDEEHSTCGVDSGQLGIFDAASYRDDSAAGSLGAPELDFVLPGHFSDGDRWYEQICRFTLGDLGYGSYDSGIVSSSGYGDGMYPLDVARNDQGQIVGMLVIFIDTDEVEEDEDLLGED